MSDGRKKLCISTGVNFLIGIVMGTVLFYAHIKSEPEMAFSEFYYDSSLEAVDFLRTWWLNIMWMLSVFIAHTVLPLKALHIVVGIRGLVSAFSLLYLMECFGIREAVVSALPQCISVLPMLMCFSIKCVEKRQILKENGKNPFSLSRTEAAMIFLKSLAAAAGEVLFFFILSKNLL